MGGGNTTQTTTSNTPYAAAQPLLNQAMQDAQRQYNNGGLIQPNTMSTVVPYANQTMQGLNQIQQNSQNAMRMNPMDGALNYFGLSNAQGGFNNQQTQAMGGMGQFANGAGNVNTSFFDQLAGNGGQQQSGYRPTPSNPGPSFPTQPNLPPGTSQPYGMSGTQSAPNYQQNQLASSGINIPQAQMSAAFKPGSYQTSAPSMSGIDGQAVQPGYNGISGPPETPFNPLPTGPHPNTNGLDPSKLGPGISGIPENPNNPLPTGPHPNTSGVDPTKNTMPGGGGITPGIPENPWNPLPGGPHPNQDGVDPTKPPPPGLDPTKPVPTQPSAPTGYGAFAAGSGDIGTQRIDQLGMQATNANPAMAGYNRFANGGGNVSAASQQQMAQTGGNNPALSIFSGMAGGQQPSMAEQNLTNIAQGGYLNRNDPNFEAALARSTDAASTAVNQQASAMGRTGSGTNQGVLAREIGNLQTDARLGQYNQERLNQTNAIGMIDQQRNQGFNNQLGAASGLGSLYGAGQDRSLNAANSASQIQAANQDRQLNGISGQGGTFQGGIGQGLQAAGMGLDQQNQNQALRMAGLGGQLNSATTAANFQGQNADRQMNAQNSLFGQGQTGQNNLSQAGSIYENMLSGQNAASQNLMGVGSAYEDLAGRQLNDQLRIAQESQNAPLANIQALLAAANGTGQYGTQYQTAQGPRNSASNLGGLLLGGGSLLSGLFGG